ncbi:MAG: hypothetical protein WHZ52_11575 [Armatimonadota bacterium]
MARNVCFSYMYRDASNWKAFGEIVVQGDPSLSVEDAEQQIREVCSEGLYFIADQVEVPEIFLWLTTRLYDDDHCWHEFEGLKETDAPVTDPEGRSIVELVRVFQRAKDEGWREFEPAERLYRRFSG